MVQTTMTKEFAKGFNAVVEDRLGKAMALLHTDFLQFTDCLPISLLMQKDDLFSSSYFPAAGPRIM